MNIYYVKPDQFTEHWEYKVRPTAPTAAVFRIGPIEDTGAFKRSRFTKLWQFYWSDLLALAKFAKLFKDLDTEQRRFIAKAFTGLTGSGRAFNNGAGTDICANYVTGEYLDREDPKIDPLICGFTHIAGVPVTSPKGRERVAVYSFLWNDTPPVPSLDDPRVMWATTIHKDGTMGQFPQLGDIPVPYPLIAWEPYFYPLEEVTLVEGVPAPPPPPPVPAFEPYAVIVLRRTVGRQQPRMASASMGAIFKGTHLTIHEEVNGWGYVDTRMGWVLLADVVGG